MTSQTPKRSLLQIIFVSPSEPRLRAGWRLLLQTLLLIVIGFGASWLANNLFSNISDPNIGMLVGQTAGLVTVTGSVFLARWLLDRRSISSLGLKLDGKTLPDLLVGIAIPFVMMGFIFAAEYALGWLKVDGFAWQDTPTQTIILYVVGAFIVFVFVGWNEELLSRGYHLQTVASGINLFWGVIISSSVFGLLHLGNPNATWVSAAGIFFAGVFLAYGFIRTRQLWLPIGLHIGWNFFEGPFFGFPVSGLETFPLIRTTINGPVLWTGGDFGPEAGLIVLPALILGAIFIYLYTYKRESVTKID
jgi:membrane protease YdiL (CAAX protease family)